MARHTRFRIGFLAVFLLLVVPSSDVRAEQTWTNPHPGVQRLFEKAGGPLRIHGLVVDLCQAGVNVRATAPGEKKRKTSSFGNLVEAEGAINGDFFSYNGYNPIGYAMGDGQQWGGTADSGWQSVVAFGLGHTVFSDSPDVFSGSWLTRDAVSGFAQIVKDGQAISSYDCSGHFCQNEPRTAVGLSADRRKLYMLVVDGRTSISVGVKLAKLAQIMSDLGAHDAVNLDGGGSSAMWVKNLGVVNDPSDGSERVVSNHLAFHADGTGQPRACNEWPPEQVWIDSSLFDAAGSTDVDGDGLGDICARSGTGWRCALTGETQSGTVVTGPDPELSDELGWNHPSHYGTIHMADINGDSLADICARGNSGIRCWFSTGDGFDSGVVTGPEWSDAEGWDDEKYYSTIRMLDLNGDGLADICGRGAAGIECALANGSGFDPVFVTAICTDAGGWDSPRFFGTLRSGDFNGDGFQDLCARAAKGVLCWPGAGDKFGDVVDGPAWSDENGFGEMRYWATLRLKDLNLDGLDDLCIRGPDGIACALSDGAGFPDLIVGPELGDSNGWHDQTNYLPIRFGDINGDGLMDVCARADAGYLCWPSTGDGFGPQIDGPAMSDENEWFAARQYNSIRLADVNGDGMDDICARKFEGLKCWLSDGNGFPETWIGPEWSDDNGWGAVQHWSTVRLQSPRAVSPCMYPWACVPGAEELETCGECGTTTRYCGDSCEWTVWGECWSDGEVNEVCSDDDVCTDDLCGTDGNCLSINNENPCEDDSICTESICFEGACKVVSKDELCCRSDSDCNSPFEACSMEFNICMKVLCTKCSQHGDCGPNGNLCLNLGGNEHFCGVNCAVENVVCPAGFECVSLTGMPAQCIPTDYSCECQPEAALGCHGGNVVWFDSCNEAGEMYENCESRGCLDAGCCPPGTRADSGVCSSAPGTDGDLTAGAETGTDGESGKGPGGSGCGTTSGRGNPSGAIFLVLAWAVLAGLRRKRSRIIILSALLLPALLVSCGADGTGNSGTGSDNTLIAKSDHIGWDSEDACRGTECLENTCLTSADCSSGYCVGHMGEKVCTEICDETSCPEGFICGVLGANTPGQTSLCLSLWPTLCRPCSKSLDCKRLDGLAGSCLVFGFDGSFCGATCDEEHSCPAGYVCETAITVEGETGDQCVPQDGQCLCSQTAIEQQLSTQCQLSNRFGTCAGSRSCTESGLSSCVGPFPAAESCNSVDDDCDGETDEEVCEACGSADACEPDAVEEQTESCGACSARSRSRSCTENCIWTAWSGWSECSQGGEGICEPGDENEQFEVCGNCGSRNRVRTCAADCEWTGWSDWSTCIEEGECKTGNSQSEDQGCGACGTQTHTRDCLDNCTWGDWSNWSSCSEAGTCTPGEKQSENQGCGNCGTQGRSRTCNDACEWGAWSGWGDCGSQGACTPGQTQDGGCDKCAQKSCESNCQWSNCKLKPGSGCLWENGNNWKCCSSGKWHFCLPSTCNWSSDCVPCTGCGC
jgi:hypothetical protein